MKLSRDSEKWQFLFKLIYNWINKKCYKMYWNFYTLLMIIFIVIWLFSSAQNHLWQVLAHSKTTKSVWTFIITRRRVWWIYVEFQRVYSNWSTCRFLSPPNIGSRWIVARKHPDWRWFGRNDGGQTCGTVVRIRGHT